MVDIFEDESPSKVKRAVIAGASEALKQKKDWKKSDDEIIQDITYKINEIISNID